MHIFSDINDNALIAALQQGAVGVLPTDTVYGLAACAADRQAVRRLYALKSRERKPGTLIAANVEQLAALGLGRTQLSIAQKYWPGAVSVIVPGDQTEAYLHQDVGSLAVRVPADEPLRALLRKTGPLVTSSANAPGQPPAATMAEAQRYFDNNVDFYVDGGNLSGRAPSTIIKVVNGAVQVVREGAVRINPERTTP